MDTFSDFLLEASKPTITEDEFTEFKYNVLVPDGYITLIKKWLYQQTINNDNYFVVEALNDVIRGIDKNLSYKAGINFKIGSKLYSVYSFGTRVIFTSPFKITFENIKKIIGIK